MFWCVKEGRMSFGEIDPKMSTLLYHPLEIDCITFKKVAPRINRDALFQERPWWAQSAGCSLSHRDYRQRLEELAGDNCVHSQDISIFNSETCKSEVRLTAFVSLCIDRVSNCYFCLMKMAPDHFCCHFWRLFTWPLTWIWSILLSNFSSCEWSVMVRSADSSVDVMYDAHFTVQLYFIFIVFLQFYESLILVSKVGLNRDNVPAV